MDRAGKCALRDGARPAKQRWVMASVGAVSLIVVSGLFLLFVFDPARHAFYPHCQLYQMTGLYCPGCGGLRAIHQLLHGRIGAAFRFNPLFVSALPFFAWLFLRGALRWWRGELFSVAINAAWFWAGAMVLIAFSIVRNLPFASLAWMRP